MIVLRTDMVEICAPEDAAGDGQAQAQRQKGSKDTVKINNSSYKSWNSARDAFFRLKNKPGHWQKVIMVDQPDGSFTLQWVCGQNFQLSNPSQFFKKHKCPPAVQSKAAPAKQHTGSCTFFCLDRSVQRPNSKNAQSAAGNMRTMNQFVATVSQAEEMKKEFLKMIVTAGLSFSTIENEHAQIFCF